MIIAVVGLGYVGLPLAIEFGKKYKTIGFDLSQEKVDCYQHHKDPTGEVAHEDFLLSKGFSPTTDPQHLNEADFIVVAVPTPVDKAHKPDFACLIEASTLIGHYMRKGTTIVFESTVYPGATEEICIPVLEQHSGLKWKKDFSVGYSPERINPGDKNRTVTKIKKVVSGDTPETCAYAAKIYGSIIAAGVFTASSIKVAEAAKVIENTQRDLNIALMNELSIIFHRMGIDTMEVLEAARTKWNFFPFHPGFVGGHCIGVDPYYLTHKVETLGYHSEIILAGRRLNDSMAHYVAQQTVKQLIHTGSSVKGACVTILGVTFKENCSDLRNSKVADLIRELQEFGCDVTVSDPIAAPEITRREYGFVLTPWAGIPSQADACILAVPHQIYVDMPLIEILAKVKIGGVFVDVKSVFDPAAIEALGYRVWRL
ncbi:MAG: nucleotide sugar dehydrogenase [Holosporales bacterium]|jgi:UDP-N-acetyl-D-galactosamine dehydrogenase|nr:nucleotide sugar dehydrogenase [Holosporales bacterium]